MGEEKPTDGTEIVGSYTYVENVWQQKSNYIPEKSDLTIIQLESDRGDIPLNR